MDLEKELEEYFAIVEGNVAGLLKDQPLEYHIKDGVIGDFSKSELITYREYLRLIKEGFVDFKKHTYRRPHMKGVHLRTMSVKALEEANKTVKQLKGRKLRK